MYLDLDVEKYQVESSNLLWLCLTTAMIMVEKYEVLILEICITRRIKILTYWNIVFMKLIC